MSSPNSADETFTTLVERADELTVKNRAMDEAPVGITIADLTREDEPLVYVNAGFERLTGYPAEETLGRNCRFLQGEDTDDDPVAAMREAIEANDSVQVELVNYRKDGTSFWSEVTLAPVPEGDGSVRYYVGFQQDVTRRKEYALELERQRDDLALLDQLIRHDIRNDLTLVLGCVKLLRDHVDGDGMDHIETILDTADHAVDLTDTAREVAEVLLRDPDEDVTVDLGLQLRKAIETCRTSHEHASVHVEGDIPDVQARASQLLESVFDNLLQNAIRHNDTDRPELTVSVRVTDDDVVVRIADNGPGVPDERKERVFERGEKHPESVGSGIGLYLVATLIDEYDGSVWIEDNEPRGAVFVLSLPLAPGE